MIEMKGISTPNRIMANPEQTPRPILAFAARRAPPYLAPYSISGAAEQWRRWVVGAVRYAQIA